MPTKLVMIIDLAKCMNCRACTVACQQENSLPLDGREWNTVIQYEIEGEGTELKTFTLPRPCMHCDEPPCAEVCPTQATWKDKRNGIVHVNYDRCIGCRYCMVACPYDVRVFNWGNNEPKLYDNPLVPVRPRGVVEKCTFCAHKTIDPVTGEATGVLPSCVETCVGGARYFGNLYGDSENDKKVREILNTRPDIFRLKEDLRTKPSVYYLPPK